MIFIFFGFLKKNVKLLTLALIISLSTSTTYENLVLNTTNQELNNHSINRINTEKIFVNQVCEKNKTTKEDTPYIETNDIQTARNSIKKSNGILYTSKPQIHDLDGEITSTKNQTIFYGFGCKTEKIEKTWINFMGKAGQGYHKTFQQPVKERLKIMGDEVCIEKNVTHPFNQDIDSIKAGEILCRGGNLSISYMCEAETIVDSAYYVVGWIAKCDEEKIRLVIADRCKDAHCRTVNPKTQTAKACFRKCETIAKNQAKTACKPRISEKAECPTEVPQGFGHPKDGSSDYHIEKPVYTDYCKKYCTVEDDHKNSCFNNKVWTLQNEVDKCGDELQNIDKKYETICGGIKNGEKEFKIEFSGDTKDIAAVKIDSITHEIHGVAPYLTLYRYGGVGENKTEIGLWNAKKEFDENNTIGFSAYHTIEKKYPKTLGDKTLISETKVGNISIALTVKTLKKIDEIEYAIIRFQDAKDKECARDDICPKNQACISGLCYDIKSQKKVIDCLENIKPSKITISQKTLFLESGDKKVENAKINIFCSDMSGYNVKTDYAGKAELPQIKPPKKCLAEYSGGDGYAPAKTFFHVRGEESKVDWVILGLIFLTLFFFAVISNVAEGKYQLNDFCRTMGEWLK